MNNAQALEMPEEVTRRPVKIYFSKVVTVRFMREFELELTGRRPWAKLQTGSSMRCVYHGMSDWLEDGAGPMQSTASEACRCPEDFSLCRSGVAVRRVGMHFK